MLWYFSVERGFYDYIPIEIHDNDNQSWAGLGSEQYFTYVHLLATAWYNYKLVTIYNLSSYLPHPHFRNIMIYQKEWDVWMQELINTARLIMYLITQDVKSKCVYLPARAICNALNYCAPNTI